MLLVLVLLVASGGPVEVRGEGGRGQEDFYGGLNMSSQRLIRVVNLHSA